MSDPTIVYSLVKTLPPKTPVYGGDHNQKGYLICKGSHRD